MNSFSYFQEEISNVKNKIDQFVKNWQVSLKFIIYA